MVDQNKRSGDVFQDLGCAIKKLHCNIFIAHVFYCSFNSFYDKLFILKGFSFFSKGKNPSENIQDIIQK